MTPGLNARARASSSESGRGSTPGSRRRRGPWRNSLRWRKEFRGRERSGPRRILGVSGVPQKHPPERQYPPPLTSGQPRRSVPSASRSQPYCSQCHPSGESGTQTRSHPDSPAHAIGWSSQGRGQTEQEPAANEYATAGNQPTCLICH
jgi:hypothetical protein